MLAETESPAPGIRVLHGRERPRANDVVCGRGNHATTHAGNLWYLERVNERRVAFCRDRQAVARSLVEMVRNRQPPGGFLRRDAGTGLWTDIGDEQAIEKTVRALRQRKLPAATEIAAKATARMHTDDGASSSSETSFFRTRRGKGVKKRTERERDGDGGIGESGSLESRGNDDSDDDNNNDDAGRGSTGLQLHRAIETKENLRVLKAILKSDPRSIRRRDANGRLPLHIAAASDASLEVVQFLIDAWLPALRQRSNYGRLPLHVAADSGAPLEVVEVLVDNWERALQERDKYGKLPLHIAAERSRVRSDVVRLLVDRWEPALHVRDTYGQLPLVCVADRPVRSKTHAANVADDARLAPDLDCAPDLDSVAAGPQFLLTEGRGKGCDDRLFPPHELPHPSHILDTHPETLKNVLVVEQSSNAPLPPEASQPVRRLQLLLPRTSEID